MKMLIGKDITIPNSDDILCILNNKIVFRNGVEVIASPVNISNLISLLKNFHLEKPSNIAFELHDTKNETSI